MVGPLLCQTKNSVHGHINVLGHLGSLGTHLLENHQNIFLVANSSVDRLGYTTITVLVAGDLHRAQINSEGVIVLEFFLNHGTVRGVGEQALGNTGLLYILEEYSAEVVTIVQAVRSAQMVAYAVVQAFFYQP